MCVCVFVCMCVWGGMYGGVSLSSGSRLVFFCVFFFQISIASNHKDDSLDFLPCGIAGKVEQALQSNIFQCTVYPGCKTRVTVVVGLCSQQQIYLDQFFPVGHV